MASAGESSVQAYRNAYYQGLKNVLDYSKNFTNLKKTTKNKSRLTPVFVLTF